MKSSRGHQYVEAHQKVPKNVLSRSKTPSTVKSELQTMMSDQILSGASTCRGTPKQSPKTYSAGRGTARYSKNRATDYDLGRNSLMGISVSRYSEIVPRNLPDRSKNPRYSQNRATNYDFRQNLPLGINMPRNTEKSPKTYSAGRKTPRCIQNRATDYDIGRNLLLGINVPSRTETVPRIVISGSKNSQVQSKQSYKL